MADAMACYNAGDCGMATPDHSPNGRGYRTGLHYYNHDNDYWTDKVGGCGWTGYNWSVEVVDQWQTGLEASERQGPAHGYNNSCTGEAPGGNVNNEHDRLGTGCYAFGPRGDKVFGGYEDALFAQHVIKAVSKHDREQPLFLVWAPHIVYAHQLPDPGHIHNNISSQLCFA
jgi:hypothetical protein